MRVAVAPSGWLWLIVLLAAALRFFPIWFGLPYPHARPDEAVAIGHAMEVLDGELNPRFFHWPSLTFYLFAGAFAIAALVGRLVGAGSGVDPAVALLIGRGVVALAGTITVVVLFRLARRVADEVTGLLAALFLAVAILHVRDSHFAMTDVLMTLLVTTSLALLVRAVDRAPGAGEFRQLRLADFALAGLAGGLAASTKYNAGAVVAAMGAAQVVLWIRWRGKPWQPWTWMPSVAFVLACAGGFLAATPYAVLDYETFSNDLLFDITHLSGGHGVNLGRGWTYHVTTSLPYGAGVVTFIAALAGVPYMLRRYPRHLFILGTFILALYAAIGSGYTVFFRYVLPLVPLVCLLAAVAVRQGSAWLAPRGGISPGAALVLVTAIVTAPALANCVWFDVLLARTDTRVVAARWLAPRLEPGQSIHDAGGDYVSLDLQGARVHHWNFDPVAVSFGHPEGKTPDWLVLTQSPIRTYASAPASLRRLASEHYDLVFTVRGTRGPAGQAVYDLQDAFFMPLSGFHTVERPGPTILIYRRR